MVLERILASTGKRGREPIPVCQRILNITSAHPRLPSARDRSGGLASGLTVVQGPLTTQHRERIVALAAQNRLPAVYPLRLFVTSGGLMSYGVDFVDMFRRAASFVDRILNGANPGELPIQEPTKVELVINRKAAKAIGLPIPPAILARADEVIE